MYNDELMKNIAERFSRNFNDFKDLYFFGSRTKNEFNTDSDYDIVLIFDDINYEKKNWK